MDIAIKEEGGYSGLEEYHVGATIDTGNIVSFSLDFQVAKRFAGIGLSNEIPERFPILLNIPKGWLKRGVDVDEFSGFESTEKEIIVGGEFTIEGIRAITRGGHLLAKGDSFKELWKALSWEEMWEIAIKKKNIDIADLESMYLSSGMNPRKVIIIVKIKQKDLTKGIE